MTETASIRTLVFDLDDTLYAEADYVRSGFAAVDAWLRERGVAEGFLARANTHFAAGVRGRIFDAALADLGLAPSPEMIGAMVGVYRRHRPEIRLDAAVAALLDSLRGHFALGLITDGPAVMQRGKIDALGLARWFDCIVVTDELGREFWKPHPEGFRRVMASLPGGYVYIGDNPAKDFVAPRALGWRTVRMRRRGGEHDAATAAPGAGPDWEIAALPELPAVIPLLNSPASASATPMVSSELLHVINLVRTNKGLPSLGEIQPHHRLREDIGFDSLDLAELTARIDEEFGVDVFAEGLVYQAGEVDERIARGRRVR